MTSAVLSSIPVLKKTRADPSSALKVAAENGFLKAYIQK
jgi:hypothetical protein